MGFEKGYFIKKDIIESMNYYKMSEELDNMYNESLCYHFKNLTFTVKH
jgi:hypothetical protein